jgi:anion-transporting  ArsA/GET3 family ATPase
MRLADLAQRRLVIVTGKGGVGKSVVAAALGRAVARSGRRVLLTEIAATEDTPSHLRASLDCAALTNEPATVGERMWAALLTPSAGHHRFLADVLPLKILADAAMRSAGLKRFLNAAPGFSDMGVLYRMLDFLKRRHPDGSDMFEQCIVDSPATGHALALAQIPELLARIIPGGPIVRAAKEGLAYLTDPAKCAAVIVTLPETLPVTESLELRDGLLKHKVAVAGVVVNRVPLNPFSVEERAALDGALDGKDVLGQRELKRISRAQKAIEVLQMREGGSAFVTLPELDLAGAELSASLASAFEPSEK